MTEESFAVTAENAGERLDKLLALEVDGLSRSSAQRLLLDGLVFVNSAPAVKNAKLKDGDIVKVNIPEPTALEAVAQEIPIDIVYEDGDLLVVNKPKGMVVHPAAGNPDNTLVNALLYHCKGRLSSINGVIRPGIVHRIDKDTSGLLIVAKNDFAHTALAEQIKEHSFNREYRAVVTGCMPDENGSINIPIGRSKTDRKKQAPNGINARNAITHYEVIEHLSGFDYCKFKLETGRTHQIRVHCAALGRPIAGDAVYGSAKSVYGLSGQCLHAALIGFVHPRTAQYLEFDSKLPDYFVEFLEKIRA